MWHVTSEVVLKAMILLALSTRLLFYILAEKNGINNSREWEVQIATPYDIILVNCVQ